MVSARPQRTEIRASIATRPRRQRPDADLAVLNHAELPGPGDAGLERGNREIDRLRWSERAGSEQDDSARSWKALTEGEIAEVLVEGEQRSALGRRDTEDFRVG